MTLGSKVGNPLWSTISLVPLLDAQLARLILNHKPPRAEFDLLVELSGRTNSLLMIWSQAAQPRVLLAPPDTFNSRFSV